MKPLSDEQVDLARLDAGELTLSLEDLDLTELVCDAIALFRPIAQSKGVSLEISMSTRFEGRRVRVDGVRVQQIVSNLLGNALKFTDAGSVTLRLATREGAEGQARARIEVIDSGVGFPPEVGARLFDRAAPADMSVSATYGGSGLGLPISKGLVELMGGAIGATLNPGGGATFWFEIPTPLVPRRDLDSDDSELSIAERFRRSRVLVVDDHPIIRSSVGLVLAELSLDVEMFDGGTAAIAAAATAPFAFGFIDLRMPGIDGVETIRRLRSQERRLGHPPARLCLLTGADPHTVAEAVYDAGVDDILTKPVTPATLIGWLRGAPA